jgi:malonyl-CoA O-methyltransferase
MSPDLFITGTDTNVGKTLLSAVLVTALDREYWKPLQTGATEGTDRETIMKWGGVPAGRMHAESYIFDPPVSPHLAAEQKGIPIDIGTIQRPATVGRLIIEGAGGVYAPISKGATMLDLMRHLGAPVVVASRTALGTINHTLLTIAAIRNAKLDLRGVVMIGEENIDNRRAIERFGNIAVIGFIPWLHDINRAALCSVFEQHFDRNAFA